MKEKKRLLRLLWSLLLSVVMLAGNPGMALAMDDATEDETMEADGSVLNMDQTSDMWLIKGQSYKLADYTYEYDSEAKLFTVNAKGKLVAGQTEGTGKPCHLSPRSTWTTTPW